MKIQILAVPYDTGHYNERMGMGPVHLLRNEIANSLMLHGHEVGHQTIEACKRILAALAAAAVQTKSTSKTVPRSGF